MIKIVQNHLEFIEKCHQFLSCNEREISELDDTWKTNYQFGYGLDIDCLKFYWGNPANFKQCRIAYVEESNSDIKSFIWWVKSHNEKVGKKILYQYIWLSFDNKNSIKLLREGINYAKENYYDSIVIGNLFENNKLDKYLLKNNFKISPKTYFKKI